MPQKGEGFHALSSHEELKKHEAANDNIELAANDNMIQGARRERAFERVYRMVEHPRKGEIFFVGDVTAADNPDKITSLHSRAGGRSDYGKQFRALAQDEKVEVITHEDILHEGGNPEVAVKTLIKKMKDENPDQVIVVETSLLMDKIITEPWKEFPELAGDMMKSGHSGKGALEDWLKKFEKGDGEEGEEVHPNMEELKKMLEHSHHDVERFIDQFIHGEAHGEFSLALTLRPSTFLFILFLKKRLESPAAIKRMLEQFSDWEGEVAHVQFEAFGKVRVKIGDRFID